MAIGISTPGVEDLGHVAEVLSGWQHDEGPLHLHPGDLGWHTLRGAAKTAASLRDRSRDEKILALGLLDGPDRLLRMAIDPDLFDDDELAKQLIDDVNSSHAEYSMVAMPSSRHAAPSDSLSCYWSRDGRSVSPGRR